MAWRKVEVARGVFGAALLMAPRPMLRHVHRVEVDRRSIAVARVLGIRQLAQAGLSGVEPSPEVLAVGIWVDTAHAATALGLAIIDPTRAFGGLLNAGAALGWGYLGYDTLQTGPVTDPAHERLRDQLARWALPRLPGGRPLLRAATKRRRQVP